MESYDIYPGYLDLYWIALDGSHSPVRLTSDGDEETLEFDESAALGRVVYRAGNSFELLLYGIDRDGTDLVQLAPLTFHVSKLRLADDTTAVFSGEEPSVLRRVRIDGSQPAVTLVPNSGQLIRRWELAGSTVLFVRPIPVGIGTFSGLYRVPIAGGVQQLLNGPPVAGQGVLTTNFGLAVSPDAQEVVFASSGPSGTTLQAVPVDGRAAPRELAPPGSFFEVRFADSAARVVFRGSEDTGDVTALFSTPLDGSSAPVRCNGALAPSGAGDVTTVQPEFDERSVVYTADEHEDGVIDLYVAKADGSAPSTRLTAPLGGVGDVESVVLARSARRAVFTYRSNSPVFTRLYGVSTDPLTAPLELDSRPAESAFPAPLLLTPDGSRVVYRSAFPDSRLFSVDRRAVPVTLAVPLAGEIGEPQLTPDGGTVVFIANLTGRVLLHAVPADGSGPARPLDTSAPAFTDVLRFRVRPDGQQVVFVADRDSRAVYELYRVPIDGSAAPVRLSATPVSGGDVESIAISANGETVVYLGDEVVDGRAELFAVPLLGGAPPARLTPLPQDFGFIANDWIVSDDGELAFYRADAATAGQVDLWAVRTDGSIPPAKLSGTMTAQGDVSSFLVTSDARHVVFLANKRSASVLELFRRSAGGPVLPVDDFTELADVTEYRLTPDGRRVVYLADRDVNGKLELFAARLDGSTPPRRLNDDLPAEADIRLGFVPLDDGSVLYRADQQEDEVIELFHLLRADTVLPADAPTRSANVVR